MSLRLIKDGEMGEMIQVCQSNHMAPKKQRTMPKGIEGDVTMEE